MMQSVLFHFFFRAITNGAIMIDAIGIVQQNFSSNR